MHVMNKININLMERHLLLLDRFVDKLVESGFSEKDITEKSYLFSALDFISSIKMKLKSSHFPTGKLC